MNYTPKTFPNGLRTLTIEDKDSLSTTILFLVNTGSRFESNDEAGIAHFVEHTIFKGTKKRPDVYQIGMEVESLGAKMNAFTSYDYTGYYIKCPKESFKQAFEILSDMFQNSLFMQSDIDKERGVILEEMRMYEDQPMDKVHSVFSELLYGEHPLGRDIIGREETIKSIMADDFKTFLGKYYNVKNTVISVAGGITHQEVSNQIEKHFGNFAKGTENKVDKEFSRDRRKKERLQNLRKPISQSHLILGGFAPSRKEKKKKYIVKVANTLLGRGFSSRLFQEIRERLGLAYYVYSQINKFEEIADFRIAMGVENSNVQNAVDGVIEQLEKVKHGRFSDVELTRAKNYLIGGLSLDLEATNQLASWYGMQFLKENEIVPVEEVKNLIKKVNKDTIVSVCEEIFDHENLYLASVSPHRSLGIEF
ncbi:hypothetical protein GF389_05185 [Candidatus Dojkabacteria bacterium]|nr:hypothetical protein [Candidatus Dojkabacteria bacterium]